MTTVRRQPAVAQLLQSAIAHHRAGALDQATALYRQVLDAAPGNADALHLLGLVASAQGDHEQAIESIAAALRHSPNFAAAHLNLAVALRAAGRLPAAAESCRRAIALQPNAAAHSTLGLILNEQGEHDAAIASCQAAIELEPNLAAARINLGSALLKLKRHEEAVSIYRTALALEPRNSAVHRDLGIALAELEQYDEALRCYRQALELAPDDAACFCALGSALMQSHDATGAEASFRRATELEPNRIEAWIGLGRVLRTMGRFDAADRCNEHVRALDPDRMETYHHLITTGRSKDTATEIERLTALLAKPGVSDRARVVAGFALGRLFDEADRYDDAFAHYAAANMLQRTIMEANGIHYDAQAFRDHVGRLCSFYTPERLAASEGGIHSELPVFIVGMPRSGTTLVEQIAASHSRIFGAGELEEIGRIENALTAERRSRGQAGAINPDMAGLLARAHLAFLHRLGGRAARVIDKLPGNILHLGLIAQLYPGARVILCSRDARDIALSCYFHLFLEDLHPYAYDLADCGSRTCETRRLATHWQRVLPLRLHELRYEDLVADIEGECRRLIEFLGLDWEPACLDFHLTERTVSTLSHWQVRQPLYTRSLGRWRHYARHLDVLFAAL